MVPKNRKRLDWEKDNDEQGEGKLAVTDIKKKYNTTEKNENCGEKGKRNNDDDDDDDLSHWITIKEKRKKEE